MLGWLGAAAAPVVIHLWMRQTHRETPWAAFRFLQAALERQARRLRLQHWLLLAIRTAILVLVALAAAKPFLDAGLLGASVPTHRLLLVDTSLSMQYAAPDASGQRVTRLDRAKRLASDLLRSSRGGDRCTVIPFSGGMAAPLGQVASSPSAVRSAIDRIEPTLGTSDLTLALAAADQVLTQADFAGDVPRQAEVLIFSDLAKQSWGALVRAEDVASSPAAQLPAAQLLDQIAERARITAVDVGEPGNANAAVTGVRLANPLPTTGEPLRVEAQVALFGGNTPRATTLELLVDDLVMASQPVTLLPGQSQRIEFSQPIATPGEHTVSVRLEEDSLLADDRRWLALDLHASVRLLCVEGARGAAGHLVDALNPEGNRTSTLQPEVIPDADLPAMDLDSFDGVIVCNVAEFSESEAEQLKRYVRGGGGVVFFLGDRVLPERYQGVISAEAVADPLSGQGPRPGITRVAWDPKSEALLPVEIAPPVTRPSYGIDPLDYAHPIAAPFRHHERAGLLTTPVMRYHPLRLATEEGTPETQVALALLHGDPLVVTSTFGEGRTAVVATAGSLRSVDPATGAPWTAMPAWPSFLPIVRGLVESVVSSDGGARHALIGESVTGPRLPTATLLQVERPDGATESLATPAEGDWAYTRTDLAGIYHMAGGAPADHWLAAINTDPDESDLRRVAISALPDTLRVQSNAETLSGKHAGIGNDNALHRTLILAALLLVLVESVLACWFGRGSR